MQARSIARAEQLVAELKRERKEREMAERAVAEKEEAERAARAEEEARAAEDGRLHGLPLQGGAARVDLPGGLLRSGLVRRLE